MGETGAGKSRLLHLWWEQWLVDHPTGRVVVLDLEERLPAPTRGLHIVPDSRADMSAHGPHYEFVNEWCKALYEQARGDGEPRLVVLDEADLAIRWGDAPPGLNAIVQRGRKENLGWMFATRRFVEIPPLLREQASELCLFNVDEPRAVRVAEQLGFDGAALRQLKVGEFYHRVRGQGAPHLHQGALSACY